MVLRLESGEQTIISPSILDLALPWTLIHPNRPNCTKCNVGGLILMKSQNMTLTIILLGIKDCVFILLMHKTQQKRVSVKKFKCTSTCYILSDFDIPDPWQVRGQYHIFRWSYHEIKGRNGFYTKFYHSNDHL